jgi:uncharacterized cupredoxin-like copper-binding protein
MARILFIGLVFVAALGVACSSGDDKDATPANAQHLTVSFGDSLEFAPPTLTVQAGRPVVLTVRNTGNTDHDFAVRDMPAKDVTSKVEGGHGHGGPGLVVGHPKAKGKVTVRFTPTTPGTYEFFCSVTGHRDAGMKGLITVA